MPKFFTSTGEYKDLMHEAPNPSFEAIHLISFLLVRFNSICKKCQLDVQQLYILAFILFEGENTETDQKMLLRGDVTRLLKAVYGSTDNQVSQWVSDLCSKGFLDEVTLSSSQNSAVFTAKKGRKALLLSKNGSAKVSFYIRELMKLRDDMVKKKDFLVAPGMSSCGPFGSGILLFMSLASRPDGSALTHTSQPEGT